MKCERQFHHALVIADIDEKMIIKKVMRKACVERRKISLLKHDSTRRRFDEKVIE